ncbi:MAG TPA: hypothetical protein VN428_26130 [Bryobacteraceae bacterium]|nr:hypothetical protein [Bryobacteraceae bacterium]
MKLATAVELSVPGSNETWSARVAANAGRRVELRSPRTLAPGTVVSVRSDEALILGEVCGAAPAGDDFHLVLELDQMVFHAEVARLARALLGEPVCAPQL